MPSTRAEMANSRARRSTEGIRIARPSFDILKVEGGVGNKRFSVVGNDDQNGERGTDGVEEGGEDFMEGRL